MQVLLGRTRYRLHRLEARRISILALILEKGQRLENEFLVNVCSIICLRSLSANVQ